ncbi:nitrate reductase molybdenum cofactor assembly chaperone [Solirubrobacter soli]|uniref:nitrate reductase molybdenum cofactor assembly chaperone n=1 Tax=Solirubrobacter soli TaxID=363832 RepID=UPI000407FBBD|nr:nitrate reductase molybdenum cofactor assembly chaperone [Solirubrobacter soli]
MRRREAPAPWALLSFLLRYPDEDVAAAREELEAEVAQLPSGEVRAALQRFLADWTADPAHFVETFDLRRRASLHLTYYAHGDTRERGMALLRLRKLYRVAGLPMESAELPDHLTVMLAFAALAPPGHGEALLAEHRPAIELLRLSLHDLGSPYGHLLDAVAACLPALSVSERSEVARLAHDGPPDEAVGLEPYGPPEAMPIGARP